MYTPYAWYARNDCVSGAPFINGRPHIALQRTISERNDEYTRMYEASSRDSSSRVDIMYSPGKKLFPFKGCLAKDLGC